MTYSLRDIFVDIKKKCPMCGKRRVMRGILGPNSFVSEACATCKKEYVEKYGLSRKDNFGE